MIEQISNTVEGNGCFATSCTSLHYHDTVSGIPDNTVLFLLDRSNNALQPVISIFRQGLLQNLIINIHLCLKGKYQPAITDLVLAFSGNLALHDTRRCLKTGFSLIIIIEQP